MLPAGEPVALDGAVVHRFLPAPLPLELVGPEAGAAVEDRATGGRGARGPGQYSSVVARNAACTARIGSSSAGRRAISARSASSRSSPSANSTSSLRAVVPEEGPVGDVARLGDLVDGGAVEALLGEQLERGGLERLAGLLLLALPQARAGRGPSVAPGGSPVDQSFTCRSLAESNDWRKPPKVSYCHDMTTTADTPAASTPHRLPARTAPGARRATDGASTPPTTGGGGRSRCSA